MKNRHDPPGPDGNRQGWMMFAHSGPLNLRALEPEDIHLGDIVHALARINRFIGQTREPISVLWHSVVLTELLRFERHDMQLKGLLHDWGEAYVGDWISPLYGMVDPAIQGLKERIQETVFAAGGLPGRSALLSKPVQIVDRLLARYESESEHGYGRPVPWHEPMTGPERERIHTAIKGIRAPSDGYAEQEHIRERFLHKCNQLLPDDAPLRRTLKEARRVYRMASTGMAP